LRGKQFVKGYGTQRELSVGVANSTKKRHSENFRKRAYTKTKRERQNKNLMGIGIGNKGKKLSEPQLRRGRKRGYIRGCRPASLKRWGNLWQGLVRKFTLKYYVRQRGGIVERPFQFLVPREKTSCVNRTVP